MKEELTCGNEYESGEVGSLVSSATSSDRTRTRSKSSNLAEHIAGCAGSGKTTLLVERVTRLQRQGMRREQVLVVSFSTAGVEALTRLVKDAAVVVLADSAKAPEVTAAMVKAAKGTLHLLLHDVHRASEGQIAGLLRRLAPCSLFSVGACGFEYPQVLHQAGWKLQQEVLRHSYRVSPGYMTLVNSLSKMLGYVQVESTEAARVRLPTLHQVATAADLRRGVVKHVKKLSAKGVSGRELCVICESALHARDMAKHLNGQSFPAIAQRDAQFLPALRQVLWLAHCVMTKDQGKVRFAPKQSQYLAHALGKPAWAALQNELQRVRATTLESIFKECYSSYLRAKGGVNARENRDLRNFFSSWEPLCIGFKSAKNLFAYVHAIDGAIVCLTPHAVRGHSWEHVIVAGVGGGVWKSRRGQQEPLANRSIIELMHLSCTRAIGSLTIFVEGLNDPVQVMERFTASLPAGAVRILKGDWRMTPRCFINRSTVQRATAMPSRFICIHTLSAPYTCKLVLPDCSTAPTAHSRISGENLTDFFMAPSSRGLEPSQESPGGSWRSRATAGAFVASEARDCGKVSVV